MKYVIKIDIDNEAFHPEASPEVARILRELANKLDDYDLAPRFLRDVNGNLVGAAKLITD